MSKYINADEVAKTLDDVAENLYGEQLDYSAQAIWAIVEKINKMPSADVVEVIRCKDCKHYILGECEIFSPLLVGLTLDSDDYCSYAEPKEAE